MSSNYLILRFHIWHSVCESQTRTAYAQKSLQSLRIETCGRFSVLESSGFELARLKFKLGINSEKSSVSRVSMLHKSGGSHRTSG